MVSQTGEWCTPIVHAYILWCNPVSNNILQWMQQFIACFIEIDVFQCNPSIIVFQNIITLILWHNSALRVWNQTLTSLNPDQIWPDGDHVCSRWSALPSLTSDPLTTDNTADEGFPYSVEVRQSRVRPFDMRKWKRNQSPDHLSWFTQQTALLSPPPTPLSTRVCACTSVAMWVCVHTRVCVCVCVCSAGRVRVCSM